MEDATLRTLPATGDVLRVGVLRLGLAWPNANHEPEGHTAATIEAAARAVTATGSASRFLLRVIGILDL